MPVCCIGGNACLTRDLTQHNGVLSAFASELDRGLQQGIAQIAMAIGFTFARGIGFL